MTPIEKNIIVVDEQGNRYEATWPRRAKGLVKNGRARFVSENMICLACPPNNILEDNNMSDIIENIKETKNTEAVESESAKQDSNIAYVLKQMELIREQTDYLNNALDKLSQMGDGDSGQPGAPGDIQGEAKAKAICDIVKCRETTNQKLLDFYERLYDDSKQKNTHNEKLEFISSIMNNPALPMEQKQMFLENKEYLESIFSEGGLADNG